MCGTKLDQMLKTSKLVYVYVYNDRVLDKLIL